VSEKKEGGVEVAIELPACWKKLVQECIKPGDRDGKWRRKPADAKRYYDDTRVKIARCSDGSQVAISLLSGQSSYYGWISILDKVSVIYEGEPVHTFRSKYTLKVDNGKTYVVKVGWVE